MEVEAFPPMMMEHKKRNILVEFANLKEKNCKRYIINKY